MSDPRLKKRFRISEEDMPFVHPGECEGCAFCKGHGYPEKQRVLAALAAATTLVDYHRIDRIRYQARAMVDGNAKSLAAAEEAVQRLQDKVDHMET